MEYGIILGIRNLTEKNSSCLKMLLLLFLMFMQYRAIYEITSSITLHADCSTCQLEAQQLLLFPFGVGFTL
jgi:hypothetical protein